jgi:hypothetical protein
MFEEKFLRMAISEGGRSLDGERTPNNIAQHNLSFCIGMMANSKEEYLEAGRNFLDNFEAEVLESIRSECKESDNDLDIINLFQNQKKLIAIFFLRFWVRIGYHCMQLKANGYKCEFKKLKTRYSGWLNCEPFQVFVRVRKG